MPTKQDSEANQPTASEPAEDASQDATDDTLPPAGGDAPHDDAPADGPAEGDPDATDDAADGVDDVNELLMAPTVESPAPLALDDDKLTGGPGFGVGGLSDVGRVRELNEDNWHWEPLDGEMALYAVADGMGGHDRGEVASRVAVETLFEIAREALAKTAGRDVESLRTLLRDAMQGANRAVVAKGEEHDSNMGTTLCSALVYQERHAFIANVGDSRVYMMRDGQLIQVSQDHSLVAYLVELGELTAEEARNHPSGNILVRSIGSVSEVEIDVYYRELQAGDRLLLCSDGLWGELTDAQLQDIMRDNQNPQAACRRMVDEANDNGGRDNTTLVVVNV